MNGPYYRNYSRSVPVHKPKVVSIPVHFISSDHHQPQTNKHSSALKIQKVFKGHTVRKAIKKLVSIKNQVNEIENRLQNDAVFVNMLRNDAKERLRVNETLMSLLFKLDSVRGVENGVRDVRKSVAKKAVALQEKVDSIAQTFEEGDDDVSNDEGTEFCDVRNSVRNEANEENVVVDDVGNKTRDQELVANEDMNEECADDVSTDVKTVFCYDDDVSNCIPNKVNERGVVDDDVSKNDQSSESVEDHVIDDVGNKNRDQELVVNEDSMKECDDDDVSNNVRNQESVENEEDMKKCDDDVSKSCCCCDDEMAVNEDRVTDEGTTKECGGDDDVSKRYCDRRMVEKLMSDNAKMMKLMKQISERNEMQTRMINSLSKRVEQLEKAFIMTDKSRRRKKSYTRREKDSFCI